MRVGSYNVLIPRVDKLNKDQESWENRKAGVVDTIDFNFDLLGLQEVSSWPPYGQASYLVEELSARGWTGYYPWEQKLFADEFSDRVPIFWRSEMFTLLGHGQLLLSSWTPEELTQVPILEARYASFVKLQTADSKTLWFYNLHLQHETLQASAIESTLARAKREDAQQTLAAHIVSSCKQGETVVVAGDFNSSKVSSCLFEIARLENIVSRTEQVENWTANSFHDWRHPVDSEHIDHVLIAGPSTVIEASIVLSNFSDHHPVRAVLEL